MVSIKSKALFILILTVTVAFAVSMRLKPNFDNIGLSENQSVNRALLSGIDSKQTAINSATSQIKANTDDLTIKQASGYGQSKSEFDAIDTHENLGHSGIMQTVSDEHLADSAQFTEMDIEQFTTNLNYSITAKDYTAFDDYALMMQDSYLLKQACIECRNLFIDILKDAAADLEFRVLSMEALSGLVDYESSQQLVNEFVSQLVKTNETNSEPATVTLIHELKQILLDSDNEFNLKALVDYYIGKTAGLIDNPISVLSAESRLLIEQEISSMLGEYYDRELITQVLRNSFYDNPGDHAQSQLLKLNYPELFVELALASQQSGLINDKIFYINHIYQNLSPDKALRGIFELSSRNLDSPENLYQQTIEWAQRNIGSYSESYDEIFSNYHDNADRSIKSVAIALAGNLYDENKAKSILNQALGTEIDPLIRKMILDELSRLNNTEQS